MNSHGKKANYTGSHFEEFVEFALKRDRYEKSPNGGDLFKQHACIPSETRCYARGVNVGKAAYGGDTQRRVDFFIVHKVLFPENLIIECKWQQVKGSVDEKYPYLVECIKTTGTPTIIVIGGNGYKPEALEWLKKQVNGITLLAVWTMEEFHIAVNNGLFSTGFAKPVDPTPKVRKVENNYSRSIWD